MRTMTRIIQAMAIASAAFLTTSCVHEWPEVNNNVRLTLTVRHELPWTEYEYEVDTGTRSGEPEEKWKSLYTFRIYRRGETKNPVRTETVVREDLSLADFEMTMTLPPGEWDIYCWQDLMSDNTDGFYDRSDFAALSHVRPYSGDTDKRDAFEGCVSVSIPESIEETVLVNGEISLERPKAKYVFIATDFDKFFKESVNRFRNLPQRWEEMTPDQREEALKDFSVVIRYPLYMPSVYNMFEARVTDSWSGVTYEAKIRPLNSDEAMVGFDYVFMGRQNSGAQVQLALKTPDGKVTGLTSTLTVPLKRGQITYVRGKFLTASVGSGLDIDFSFSGDFNIKVE